LCVCFCASSSRNVIMILIDFHVCFSDWLLTKHSIAVEYSIIVCLCWNWWLIKPAYIYIAVWANILDGFKGLVEHIFYWKLWFFPFHKWGHGWVAHFKPLLGCKRFAELRIFDGSTPCVFVSLLAGGTPIYSGQTQMLTD
jgi:hypothetical protein